MKLNTRRTLIVGTQIAVIATCIFCVFSYKLHQPETASGDFLKKIGSELTRQPATTTEIIHRSLTFVHDNSVHKSDDEQRL